MTQRRALLVGISVLALGLATGGRSETEARLNITPAILDALEVMRREPKFAPTEMYTGFQPPSERLRAEGSLNGLIDGLIRELPTRPTKEFVIERMNALLPEFEDDDTEDREQLCKYLVRIKDIVGIDSLNGLLNRWLYGVDPTSGRGN